MRRKTRRTVFVARREKEREKNEGGVGKDFFSYVCVYRKRKQNMQTRKRN